MKKPSAVTFDALDKQLLKMSERCGAAEVRENNLLAVMRQAIGYLHKGKPDRALQVLERAAMPE